MWWVVGVVCELVDSNVNVVGCWLFVVVWISVLSGGLCCGCEGDFGLWGWFFGVVTWFKKKKIYITLRTKFGYKLINFFFKE